MKIHKEGKNIIVACSIIFILINIFIAVLFQTILLIVSASISGILLITILQFFRNPERRFFEERNCINSPADGKIIFIERCFESEYFKIEMLKVSIFMSITNVHVNRIPVSGKVIYTKYHPGKYLVAFHPKSSELNERNTIVFEDDLKNQILIRQIAGAVARRIRSYIKENESVIIGEELGFIKFGSRVDIFLPDNAKLNVRLNQKVYGNRSVIAFFD